MIARYMKIFTLQLFGAVEVTLEKKSSVIFAPNKKVNHNCANFIHTHSPTNVA